MRKPLIATLAAVATLLAAGAAQAGGNVQWSVGVNLPNVSTAVSNFPFPPVPTVVVQQAPVYYEPAPRVVYQRPVVVHEPVVIAGPVHARGWDRGRDGVPNRNDRVDNRWHGAYGDRDRDGVPNRYDRVDNRYGAHGDRDRHGVPNRYDHRDDRKHRQ